MFTLTLLFTCMLGYPMGFLGQIIGPAMGLAGQMAGAQAQVTSAALGAQASVQNQKIKSSTDMAINASQIHQRASEDLRGRMRQVANAQTSAVGEMVRGFQQAFLRRQLQ